MLTQEARLERVGWSCLVQVGVGLSGSDETLVEALGPGEKPAQTRPQLLPNTFPVSYHTGCTGCASEEQLFHTLFAHYNRFIRPVENVSDPVTVHFELAITQLANVVSASDP